MKILSAHISPRHDPHQLAVVVVAQLADGRAAAFAIDGDTGRTLRSRFVRDLAEVGIALLELQNGGFPPIIDEPLPPPPPEPHGSERVVAFAQKLWRGYQDARREAAVAAGPG